MNDIPLDVFLHLPKTAGTSFNTLLTRAYGAQHVLHVPDSHGDDGSQSFGALNASSQATTHLVRGHILHGLDRHVDRPVRYFTVLRDPQSRIRSYLDHMASEAALSPEDDRPWLAAIREWKDFENYAAWRPRQVDNYMVRALSGMDFPPGECTEDILETAKAHLDAMPAFGLQEHLAESILVLKRRMNWHVLPVLSRAKSGNPRRITLSKRDHSAIEVLNRHDRALYDYARARFEQKLEAEPGLAHQAALIRRLTPAVTRAERLARRLRKRTR